MHTFKHTHVYKYVRRCVFVYIWLYAYSYIYIYIHKTHIKVCDFAFTESKLVSSATIKIAHLIPQPDIRFQQEHKDLVTPKWTTCSTPTHRRPSRLSNHGQHIIACQQVLLEKHMAKQTLRKKVEVSEQPRWGRVSVCVCVLVCVSSSSVSTIIGHPSSTHSLCLPLPALGLCSSADVTNSCSAS